MRARGEGRAPRAKLVIEPAAPFTLATVAATPFSRMIGLLARRSLDEGDGLVLRPCSMVHTWFMRFAIDVIFLDRHGTVLRVVDTLRPFGVAWGGWRARTTIELPAGAATRAGVRAGQRIRIDPA